MGKKFRQRRQRLVRNEDRARHKGILGASGTGKSKGMETEMVQDMAAGRGFGLFDVHGDQFEHMKLYVAQHSLRRPEITERTVIINPEDSNWGVSFNPLEAIEGLSRERVAMFLTDVIVKVWNVDPATSPRMVWLMTNSFLALSDLGLTLLDLPRWLGDAVWRNQLVPRLSHDQVRAYWQYEFPKNRTEAQVWIAPVLNKLGPLMFDPDIGLMLAGNSRLTMRQVLDEGLILLVNVPKGVLGEGGSFMLAAFLVALIQKAALARADTQDRPPFYLYLDEFQNYATSNIEDILTESRKYNLSLMLSCQHLAQIQSDELRSAFLNTTGSLQCYRVGHQDAMTMAKEIFPGPDYDGKGTDSIPKWLRQPEETWMYRDWERLVQQLVNLLDRVFWYRRRGPYLPSRQRNLYLPDPVMTPQLAEAAARLEEISGQCFGRRKQALQLEMADVTARQDQLVQSSVSVATQSPADVNLPADEPQPEPDSPTPVAAEPEADADAILMEVLDEMAQGSVEETWDLPFREVS